MRLLICTQMVDQNNPVLGFFHRWIEEFAKHVESVIVICLCEGEHHLPSNVRVLSLGKEGGRLRIKYLIRFYSYIWSERHNYDTVFVHMNQEYILLGGLFWRFLGKRVAMWRNHYRGSFLTDITAALCNIIFCTSRYSYTARYAKTKIMPVGVDASRFHVNPSTMRASRSVLFLSRISPSKKVEILVDALELLHNKRVDYRATIVGSALPHDEVYYERLKGRVHSLGLADGHVVFEPGVSNNETPRLYGSHQIFVNTSPSGMLDKTIFEAMACGALILVSNKDLVGQIPAECSFEEGNVAALAAGLERLLVLNENRKEAIRSALLSLFERHTLAHLVTELRGSM